MGPFDSVGMTLAYLGAAVLVLLFELALAWAATALIDAEIGLPRLAVFTLAATVASGAAFAAVYFPLQSMLPETITTVEANKVPWTALAIYTGVGLVFALIIFGALAWPMLGVSVKHSIYVGIFTALLRVLLYSLLGAGLAVVLASLQIYQGPRSADVGKTPSAQVVRA